MPESLPIFEFRLPDLGEGLSSAEIVNWYAQVGDHVVEGQPLAAVETDKAVVEIPSPRSGRIDHLHAAVGDILNVGALMVSIAVTDETRPEAASSIVGKLPEAPQSSAPRSVASPIALTSSGSQQHSSAAKRIKASPKARQRARELGVELESVAAKDGVVQVSDVENAAAAPDRLRGVRRVMAQRMQDAQARVARATVTGDADIRRWPQDARPMLRLIRAVGVACCSVPELNTRYDDRAGVLAKQSIVNIGIAMETPDGLFTPVLKDVCAKDADQLSAELDGLRQSVKDRSIERDALRGQTITLSNFGAVGGLYAEMIVVPPQVAIVGAGRVFERFILCDGKPDRAAILPLSISFDHRVVTGIEAVRFLEAVVDDLAAAG
jgi:pyruvate dehydrogenase E2 component (dihydrolipoamide acetyltransferase)